MELPNIKWIISVMFLSTTVSDATGGTPTAASWATASDERNKRSGQLSAEKGRKFHKLLLLLLLCCCLAAAVLLLLSHTWYQVRVPLLRVPKKMLLRDASRSYFLVI